MLSYVLTVENTWREVGRGCGSSIQGGALSTITNNCEQTEMVSNTHASQSDLLQGYTCSISNR
jgi:hypothetical protein